MSHGRQVQFAIPPVTQTVKMLVIANVAIWIGLIIIAQNLMGIPISKYFGMSPDLVINSFHIWQPFTYMFLHSAGVWHVLFNMLILWMFGSELELQWGRKFFLTYYLVSGVGAAVIYCIVVLFYQLFVNPSSSIMGTSVVGASGAVFGIILAYGIIFSERVMLFMMIFPMKAKYFAMILGGIEVITLLNTGFASDVANLAHLGGLISGFLFLWGYTKYNSKNKPKKGKRKKNGRNLRLVVNNESPESGEPKYWN